MAVTSRRQLAVLGNKVATRVLRLISLFNRQDWTGANESSQGWQAIEDKLRLAGWSEERRPV